LVELPAPHIRQTDFYTITFKRPVESNGEKGGEKVGRWVGRRDGRYYPGNYPESYPENPGSYHEQT